MNTKSIKDILSEYFKGTSIDEINDIINMEKIWKEAVGKTAYNKTKVIEYKNKTLTIKTSNPVWRNELFLQKKDIIKKINNSKHKPNIIEIIFK